MLSPKPEIDFVGDGKIVISPNPVDACEVKIRANDVSYSLKGQVFSYTSHDRLREAIEKKLFADLKDIVKITTSTRTPDEDQLRRINDVVNRLIQEKLGGF